MELKDYIEKRGEEPLAKELGVSKKLIKLTGHALDWESIYGSVEV